MDAVPAAIAAAHLAAHPRCACGAEATEVRARIGGEVVVVRHGDDMDFGWLKSECATCARRVFDAMMKSNRSLCG